MGQEYIRRELILGSVPNLGPVILSDDMEGLFKWTGTGNVGFTAEKSTTVAYNGSASMHLKTRVAGAAANDWVNALRDVCHRPGMRYSFECLFQLGVTGDTKEIIFSIGMRNGTVKHVVRLCYDSQNDKWCYWNSAGAYADIPGGSQDLFGGSWHRLLFDFDENKGQYLRMICDGLEISLIGLAYQVAADANPVWGYCEVWLVAQAATPPELWIDDVLVMEI